MNDYEGPVRLLAPKRIPWGTRDRATAFAVLQNMVDATPPVVIPWSIHQKKVKNLLRHQDIFDIGVKELIDLVTRRSSHHHAPPVEQWFTPSRLPFSTRCARHVDPDHRKSVQA